MNFNTRLFFTINRLAGKNHWIDAFGQAGAEWVIIGMVAWYLVGVFTSRAPEWHLVVWALVTPFVTGAVALAMDWLIAEIVREPRPAVTHPSEVKLLFQPLVSTWKSFPSDHAMGAWLIVLMAFIFGVPGAEALVFLALWVSFGRVYAGVHYPYDILGGFGVALATSIACYAVLLHV